MSMSDSDSSSQGGEYKNFRQISRDRLLYEMLRSAKTGDSKSSWKVLIMDKITVKIMSYACKMADITEEGVSLVEDIHKRRQPLPTMDAIYFIQPTKENIVIFLSDMSGRSPLYRKAFIFFSSPVSRELVSHIKKDGTVLSRIGALREMNLEYFSIDSQGFVTDNDRALEDLFGDDESSRKGDACLNLMATRIATVFASLREFPSVRYRAAKSLDPNTMTTFRDLIPTKLAAAIWNCLIKYKSSLPNFPQSETCELIILDRSIDQIAPIIHEWTYDAMCHDLLNMEGNKYVHQVPSKTGGLPEKKEVLLEDHDPIWLELRHSHIAHANERLHEKMTNFVSKNKAAQIHGSRDGELSTRDLQKMVQALPQYSEQIEKLSLHVDIAGKLSKIIGELGLKEVGQLEQDLVFGDAATNDLINFLRVKEDVSRENKLRLLMIYAAVYPEKFEDGQIGKLMELARLPMDDMNAVYNMKFLEASSDTKKSSIVPFSLKFDVNKKKHAARKDRPGEESTWQLSRFYPVIEELIEKLSKGELPKNDYPCMNDPSPTFHGTAQGASVRTGQFPPPHSMRSRRTATWARPQNSDDGYSSDSILRHASSDFTKMGQRIFVFIVGGATRSELRVCHKLSTKLKREIVLGSSSLDDPPQFITGFSVLVTGTAGFVGTHVAISLKQRGDGVVGFDNFNNYYEIGLKKARKSLLERHCVFIIEGDINDAALLGRLFEIVHFTHVMHLAAQAGVRYAMQNPSSYIHSNVNGFVTLLEACKNATPQPSIVWASSSSVYGINSKVPFSEKDRTDQPASLYAATKKAGEEIAHAYNHIYGLSITGLRFFTVYGPWGRPDMAYYFFTKDILRGKEIKIFEGGNHATVARDFTYIDDVVKGCLAALDAAKKSTGSGGKKRGAAQYKIYNLGNTSPVPVAKLVSILEKLLKTKAKKKVLPMPTNGDVLFTHANISLAAKELGYKPSTDLETGLQKFVEWYLGYYGSKKKGAW